MVIVLSKGQKFLIWVGWSVITFKKKNQYRHPGTSFIKYPPEKINDCTEV